MSTEPDKERLADLERRISKMRQDDESPDSSTGETVSQAQMAWRMIVELIVGIGMGVGLGYGLDRLFGTEPWMLVLFTLFGFAAGVRVMLQTAQEIGQSGPDTGDEPEKRG